MPEKLDEIIDALYMLRERKRGLEAQIKETNQEIDLLNLKYIERCDEVGTVTARGRLASATITETVVPRIEDWDEVAKYVIENDAIYLLHRRVSSGPWRELQDMGEDVPGISPFTKRAVSLRKLGD